jgi:benzoyl-CoA reductase/2-hydroxyglutaryl-CoA dehydratase subunit BcrC/BadD/HgdB
MAVIGAERFEELRLERLDELRRLRAEGVKVVGFFSHYVPVELICAAGAEPVRLLRGGYDAEVRGERYLRSDACPVCLSTVGNFELGRSGANLLYGSVDALVSVNTCDMLRRLPETLHRHFGLPVFDVYMPRTSESLPHRLAEFRRQLEWLGRELGAFTGRGFDAVRLASGIGRGNRTRERLRAIDAARLGDDPAVGESDILDLVALAGFMDPDRFGVVLEDVKRMRNLTLEGRTHQRTTPARRHERRSRPLLMMGGSEVAWQDRWLVNLVEDGADIVTDLLHTGTRWFADDCGTGGDPMDDLAEYYFTRPDMMRRPNCAVYTNVRWQIKQYRVSGLVYKTLLYCDPWSFEAVRLRNEIGVPMLTLDGNYSTENREQIRTRVEAFMENL